PAHYGLTHGIAVGILLPHVIRFNIPAAGALYADLAHEAALTNGDSGAGGEALAGRITDLMRVAGLPTRLSACGVSSGIFAVLAEEAAQQWTGKPAAAGKDEWLLFRGNAEQTGVTSSSVPNKLGVLWQFKAEDSFESAVAVSGGVVYAGSMDEHLYAINLKDGKQKWKYKGGP